MVERVSFLKSLVTGNLANFTACNKLREMGDCIDGVLYGVGSKEGIGNLHKPISIDSVCKLSKLPRV